MSLPIDFNSADTAEHIIKATKHPWEKDPTVRPLLFGPTRPFLNFMQYAGNYECYSDGAFTKQGGEAWRPDPNAPHPLQLARMNTVRETYDKKSEAELWADGRKIIDKALDDHRQVLIALPTFSMPVLKGKFVKSGYTVESRDKWKEPVKMSEEAVKAFHALGPWVMFMGLSTEPKDWDLVEVTKKPSPLAEALQKPPVRATTKQVAKPTSKPTTTPTTKPSTKPTTRP